MSIRSNLHVNGLEVILSRSILVPVPGRAELFLEDETETIELAFVLARAEMDQDVKVVWEVVEPVRPNGSRLQVAFTLLAHGSGIWSTVPLDIGELRGRPLLLGYHLAPLDRFNSLLTCNLWLGDPARS